MSSSRPTSEIAVTVLSLVTVLTCWRLFIGWSFLVSLTAAALLSHLLSALLRRAGLPSLPSFVVSMLGLALFVTLTRYPDTSFYGLPTRHTWDTAWADLSLAWNAFATTKAPVPSTGGYLVAAIVAVWCLAHLSDDLAFRAGSVAEPILPQTLLFVAASALAGERMRLLAVAMWVPVAVATVAVLRVDRVEGGAWFGGDRRGATGAGLRVALGVGAAAVAVGLMVGPWLPGAGARPLIDPGGGGSSRTTVSPLVDIRSRLVNQSDVEVFSVAAPEPAYWRLTALDEFDGRIWRSSRRYGSAEGALAADSTATPFRNLTQEITVSGLDSVWLPAAFTPVRFANPAIARFDRETASLLTRDSTSQPGTRYTVVSRVPVLTAADVAAAAAAPAPDIDGTYLALPDDFPDDLAALAAQVAGPSVSPYERALNLQAWFRTFTYDLDGPGGHGNDAMRTFLEQRRGYCEQFAGTFAAFARSLGIPSRVAVGFTPGDAGADGVFRVRGRNAHAWPEVYFRGIGWVPFEPTPGRGAPGNEGYTGVAFEQDPAAAPGAPATATTAQPSPAGPVPQPSIFDPADLGGLVAAGGPVADEASGSGFTSVPWLRVVGIGLLVVVGGALAVALLAPVISRLGWLRAWAQARSPTEKVLVSWRRALDALRRHGTPAHPSETPGELTTRLAHDIGAAREPLGRLADAATLAAFAPGALGPEQAKDAATLVGRFERVLRRQLGWRQRVVRRLDPRASLPVGGLTRRA